MTKMTTETFADYAMRGKMFKQWQFVVVRLSGAVWTIEASHDTIGKAKQHADNMRQSGMKVSIIRELRELVG